MKFSVCADIMYQQMDFVSRIKTIKNDGFDMIEFWQWSNKDIVRLKHELDAYKVSVFGFCVDSSDKGISNMIAVNALNSDKTQDLLCAIRESIEVSKYLRTKNLIITVGDIIPDISLEEQLGNIEKNLQLIESILKENEITLLIESINRHERSKYLLPNVKDVIKLVKDTDNIRVLYDVYHQNMERDYNVREMIEKLSYIGHIHIADCPGRGEPGTGTINYKEIFEALRKNNYRGTVGLEYIPAQKEAETFEIVKNL